jgi:hypothetical protein
MKQICLLSAVYACLLSTSSLSVYAAAVSGQGTWESTLQARDFDGDASTIEGWYDTVLGITWLADANYAGTTMNWETANGWAAGLDVNGITGWRLPTLTDSGNDGCSFGYTGTDCGWNGDTSTSEMASMFYDTLGNKAYYDTSGSGEQSGWGLTNTGPFSNLQSSEYWSDVGYAPDADFAWLFLFYDGLQDVNYKTNSKYAWAVHPDNVGAAIVPVPAAVWLFGSGLLGLVGVARRKAA